MDIDMDIEIIHRARATPLAAHRRDIEWLVLGLALLGLFTAVGRLEGALVELAAARVDALGLPIARAGV
ncbi:MAG: hypothetical protein KC457_17515, partial [Myxococcales bacterium]|nr:hypothetical protein [Myxococcales bacterium]